MDYRKRIENRIIDSRTTIIQALKVMDIQKVKLLFVYQEDFFIGIVTIGDIQRAIIGNIHLNKAIIDILDTHKIYAYEEESFEIVKKKMLQLRTECMPVVNGENKLVNVYFWEDLFPSISSQIQNTFDLPIVIMAGGQGSRLRPLTNIFPKPLLPIHEKTIVEEIMDRFVAYGSNRFYLSVNYKADVIKRYFNNLKNHPYRIEYFQEPQPLGTIGSLYLLKDKVKTTFFISNCDILIDEDYSEILKYHRENRNEITVVAALKNYPIPYGVLETSQGGVLKKIEEKPDITFKINTGVYILEPHLLNEIPENQFYHITHLIDKVQQRRGKVGVFPVSENSWVDIGDWNEYNKIILSYTGR